jgi:L-gulono-1,4-lactone dehydrogenase
LELPVRLPLTTIQHAEGITNSEKNTMASGLQGTGAKSDRSGQPAPIIENFGANQVWQPHAFFTPTSEGEVLALLRTHRGRRFRAVGRLHSWSPAAVGTDVVFDLRHLNDVNIHADAADMWVEVGAGCQVKRLLDHLNRHGFTLPSVGLIDEQTIAGATATGTHGSGKNSLGHYIQGARVARFDPQTQEPVIHTITSGPELEAARCSLGCLGIITSVRMAIRKQYHVEEHFRAYEHLEDVLAEEETYPIQQFYWLPWRWDFLVQHRREVELPISRLVYLYRLYWYLGMDIGLHLLVRMLARYLPTGCTKFFFRRVVPMLVPKGWHVVDRSQRQLTMQHELFRHIETEIFVKRSLLSQALDCAREIVQRFSDTGRYTHHYPICIRKVLPDAALISMSSSCDEPVYALSFISYVKPNRRDGFFALAEELATTLAARFDARPHWGKHCPLPPSELRRLYPRFADFAAIAKAADPSHSFRNEWLESILEVAMPNASNQREGTAEEC